MGYNLTIGELDRTNSDSLACVVVTLPDAPADNSPTDHTNQRWPSYGGWSDFCESAGIADAMDKLMPEHPGVAAITPALLAYVEGKIAQRRGDMADHDRNRADWLLFWMRWAVENCDSPVFVNR